MLGFRFKHVCIESYALHLPTTEVSSAEVEDRLAPLYTRLGLPFGTLEKLSGIKTRRLWNKEIMPSQVATEAARMALENSGIDSSQIGALFNCSVCRDYFEPATAALVHGNLKLSEQAITMDISNACIGFSNGLLMMANLIESGVIKAGILTSGENVSGLIEPSIARILKDETIGREDLLRLLPTFTLGSAAVSFVMAHDSIATKKHRVVGSVSRSATNLSDLCIGNSDFCFNQQEKDGEVPLMYTDSQRIISEAAKLGARTWPEVSELLGWSAADVDHIFSHQVGKQLGEAFYREIGLDHKKEFPVYPRYGNLVSAALPAAFVTGISERAVNEGNKILLTAFGSGLNAIFTGVVW